MRQINWIEKSLLHCGGKWYDLPPSKCIMAIQNIDRHLKQTWLMKYKSVAGPIHSLAWIPASNQMAGFFSDVRPGDDTWRVTKTTTLKRRAVANHCMMSVSVLNRSPAY